MLAFPRVPRTPAQGNQSGFLLSVHRAAPGFSPRGRQKNKTEQMTSSDMKKILSVFPIRDYQDGFFLTDDNRIIDLFQARGRSYFDASDV